MNIRFTDDEQQRAVHDDVRRINAAKMAAIRARRPSHDDGCGLDENDHAGKTPAQVEFSARVYFWCALILVATVLAAVILAATK